MAYSTRLYSVGKVEWNKVLWYVYIVIYIQTYIVYIKSSPM